MIVNADVKALEVYVAADLSQDKVLLTELNEGQDVHQNNQDAFKLPNRGIAKIFKFKLLYGATAYGFAQDSDFTGVSRRETFWQDVIDKYYDKYKGVHNWHTRLIKQAQTNGYLEIPSGRYYPISPVVQSSGRIKWPETVIKNYPVQGFGADLVKLARIEAFKQFRQKLKRSLLIGTIHDSIVADAPEEEVEECARILKESIAKVPELCYTIYHHKFSLPMLSEIMVGKNKNEMELINV